MIDYRITKYNPAKRNAEGTYLDMAEWTSICDIGKPDYGYPTYEDYEKIESAYVQTVLRCMNAVQSDSLVLFSLECRITKERFQENVADGFLKNLSVDLDEDIKSLHNGQKLEKPQLEKVIRLILREIVWMRLGNKNMQVTFGWDYYMYIKTLPLSPALIQEIESWGLFVEPHTPQRTIVAYGKSY